MDADLTQARDQLERRIAGDFPPGDHPIQPAGLPAVLHQLSHVIDRKMKVELEARRARLGDLDQRLAPAKDIANVDVLFGEPGGGEVFAERRGAEPIGLLGEFTDPVGIVFARIMTQRAVRPAVDFLLRLLVPIETEIAELMERSERSIRRDWQKARMFLLSAMQDS